MIGKRLIVWLPAVIALAACESTPAPTGSLTQTATPSGPAGTTPFQWPKEHKDSPDLSFPSAADAVKFLSEHMDADIALPTWVPSIIHLDTSTSVFVGTVDGKRRAQLYLTTKRGDAWGIQYGVSGLDGCAPEHSRPVKVSGQPGRLRVSADPEDSSRKWTELIWPATLKHPIGVYGLFGWLPPRTVLAMADSMPPVSSPPVLTAPNC